jgi:hypothetical protein
MRLLLTAAAVALVSLTPACQTISRDHAVLNIPDTPFLSTTEASDVQIKRALTNRGWGVVEESPGVIVAKYTKVSGANPHIVTSKITYDDDSFSIDYVSSSNMRYDAEDGTIHRNYNRWVANLHSDLSGG